MLVAFLSHTYFHFGCLNMDFILDGKINHNKTSKRVNKRCETGLSPPVKYFTDLSRRYFFCGYFILFCLVFVMPLCASVYLCLMVTCWKGLTSWLSFVVYICGFVTFPLVTWVRCGTCLYRFLICAPLLTFLQRKIYSENN